MMPPLARWVDWLSFQRDAYARFIADEALFGLVPLDRFCFGYERARWCVEALRHLPPLPVELRAQARAAL